MDLTDEQSGKCWSLLSQTHLKEKIDEADTIGEILAMC